MKTLSCAALLSLVSLAIFLFQRPRLETLRHETQALEASVRERVAADMASPADRDRRRGDHATDVQTEESVERVRAQVALTFQMLLIPVWNQAQHQEFEQIRNKMILDLVDINHHSAFDILTKSLEIPGISQGERNRLIEGYVRIYTDANPLETLRLLELLPEYQNFKNQLIKAYLRTSIAIPGHAVAWFEEQSRSGNPITGDPEIIRASLTAQSRNDPAQAVARMANLQDSEDTKTLGHALVIALRDTSEHLAFAAALKNELAKPSVSPLLSEVRDRYASELMSRLNDWPFEEAVLLMDACLTPEEKLKTANELMFYEKDQDAGKWAAWLASMEVADHKTHPLSSYIGRWALSDPAAAMNWLENIASGKAKERGIIGFANYMAEKDPRNAIRLLNTLPGSKQRSNTLQRVRERWRKVDQAAEAEYDKAPAIAK